jgi:hypothetical protein
VDDLDERIEIWKRIAVIPEPLGYDTETMFGSYDFPNLTMLRLKPMEDPPDDSWRRFGTKDLGRRDP